jgi:threonine dehydrogenase-like Zn-dependent dehydrogenase
MKSLYFQNSLPRVLALKAASVFNRYAALGPLSTLRYQEVPEPEIPGPRWLKVRNLACGLCGTDLHFMFMEMAPRGYAAALPGVAVKDLGHEVVGEVVEVGAEVGTARVGDRVAMRIDWPSCAQLEIEPACEPCSTGRYMLCRNVGTGRLPLEHPGGGFSPRMVMHRSQPFVVPPGLSTDAALLLEPLASAIHGVLAAPPQQEDKVLVVGAGTIGLLTVAAVRAMHPGTQVWCATRYRFQSDVAESLGARVMERPTYADMAKASGARHVTGYLGNQILLGGFDRVYDTVGNDQSLHDSLRWVRPRGSVVLMGINFDPGRVDYSPVWAREIVLTGINCHATEADGRTSFDIAGELLLAGVPDPSLILTHRFPMNRYKDAVRTFLNKAQTHAIKVVLEH